MIHYRLVYPYPESGLDLVTDDKALVNCKHCLNYLTWFDTMEKEEPMASDRIFYMVLVDGTSTSIQRHSTHSGARIEAERLLQLMGNQDKGATILKAVAYGTISKRPVDWSSLERGMA